MSLLKFVEFTMRAQCLLILRLNVKNREKSCKLNTFSLAYRYCFHFLYITTPMEENDKSGRRCISVTRSVREWQEVLIIFIEESNSQDSGC